MTRCQSTLLFGEKKTCIACGQPCDNDGTYVHYEIKNNANKTVGKMDVHRTIHCFPAGSTILRKQHEQTINASSIVVASRVDGRKYTFLLIREKDYFVLPLYTILHKSSGTKYELRKDMYRFLQEYLNANMLVMIHMESLRNTPESHIPLLASVQDPMIPPGLIESKEYQKRKSNAVKDLQTSMNVRGRDKTQAIQIMYQYMQDTAILL